MMNPASRRPPGLKPDSFCASYAALKRRSSTALPAAQNPTSRKRREKWGTLSW
jgi:hypothetical protein